MLSDLIGIYFRVKFRVVLVTLKGLVNGVDNGKKTFWDKLSTVFTEKSFCFIHAVSLRQDYTAGKKRKTAISRIIVLPRLVVGLAALFTRATNLVYEIYFAAWRFFFLNLERLSSFFSSVRECLLRDFSRLC